MKTPDWVYNNLTLRQINRNMKIHNHLHGESPAEQNRRKALEDHYNLMSQR